MYNLQTQTILVALPKDASFEGINVWTLLESSVNTENKILAEVAELDNERARFMRIQERVEYAAKGLYSPRSKKLAFLSLHTDYLDLLAQIFAQEPEKAMAIRVGATTFTHEQVNQHAAQLPALLKAVGLSSSNTLKDRLVFFNKIKRLKRVIVELQIPWRYYKGDTNLEETEVELAPTVIKQKFDALATSDSIANPNGNIFKVAFSQSIKVVNQVAAGQPGMLNLGLEANFHNVITETMHRLAYLKPRDGQKPIQVPIVYTDGSEAPPITVISLQKRRKEQLASIMKLPERKMGMLTTRHPEMDVNIQLYSFRNQEVSVGGAAAKIDKLVYKKAHELLKQAQQIGPIRLGFYQTGFPPAVIGFFRAVTEVLMQGAKRKPFLVVQPYYFDKRKNIYRKGNIWT